MNVELNPNLRRLASAALLALIVLCVAWETVLAPIRPGGSWLLLKALPLAFPLRGVLRGNLYTYQWASMLILLYLMEGVVRAPSAFSMILTWPPSMTATQLLVVPRSMPMILLMVGCLDR